MRVPCVLSSLPTLLDRLHWVGIEGACRAGVPLWRLQLLRNWSGWLVLPPAMLKLLRVGCVRAKVGHSILPIACPGRGLPAGHTPLLRRCWCTLLACLPLLPTLQAVAGEGRLGRWANLRRLGGLMRLAPRRSPLIAMPPLLLLLLLLCAVSRSQEEAGGCRGLWLSSMGPRQALELTVAESRRRWSLHDYETLS